MMGVASTTRLAALAVTLARIAGREVDLIALETAPPLLYALLDYTRVQSEAMQGIPTCAPS